MTGEASLLRRAITGRLRVGFLYGKNPLGGAVNIVRKQPEAADAVAAHGSLGSFTTTEAGVDWNRGGEGRTPRVRVNAVWRESDGFRDGQDSWLGRRIGLGKDVAGDGEASDRKPEHGLRADSGERTRLACRRWRPAVDRRSAPQC